MTLKRFKSNNHSLYTFCLSYTNVIKVFFLCHLLRATLFHAILIKKSVTFFAEWEQIILHCICKHQTPCIAKAVLKRKKNKSGGIMPLNFRLIYKATGTKAAWYWHKNSHTDQWNRIDSTEICPHTYRIKLWGKRQEYTVEKGSLFNKSCWKNWTAPCKRTILNH